MKAKFAQSCREGSDIRVYVGTTVKTIGFEGLLQKPHDSRLIPLALEANLNGQRESLLKN